VYTIHNFTNIGLHHIAVLNWNANIGLKELSEDIKELKTELNGKLDNMFFQLKTVYWVIISGGSSVSIVFTLVHTKMTSTNPVIAFRMGI
jgi:hypothetical protein